MMIFRSVRRLSWIPALSFIFFCGSGDLPGADSRILLSSGGSVTGDLLKEHPDRVIVDLGFTVLTIPREVVTAVEVLDGSGEVLTSDAVEAQLYQVGGFGADQGIKELADNLGEAVVLVETPVGLGSGFVIDAEGYVITNDHVIAGENEITVTVFVKRPKELERMRFENVRIVASNSVMDLALLKIEDTEGRSFSVAPVGQSSRLRAGQRVFAIGSPLGLDRSVSEGIISVKNRPIGGRLFIQTTTEISPGNSGGPLFNLRGEVVGVNNMKVVGMGAEGLGFAIPSNMLKLFLENRDAFAFDPRNANSGFRYNRPPVEDGAETQAQP
ncbi:MAG: S1C family serine protease [Opitutales bacterium]